MKGLFTVAATVACLLCPAVYAEPENVGVHSVMFYMTINEKLEITHAQVIGGYADQESCRRAVAIVSTIAADQLKPGETPEFLCPEVRAPQPGDDAPSDDAPRPKVSL
jgi:hypothetical protein